MHRQRMIQKKKIVATSSVPLSVPKKMVATYKKNMKTATGNSPYQRLFLFAGDQKIEHLNEDFYGPTIPEECGNPEHLFAIASQSRIGVFATQLGLIARYGAAYPKINYVVKMNAKTNIIPTTQQDPLSLALCSIEQVIAFKKQTGLNIIGIGYTIYPGSEHEATMFAEAAHLIHQAHKHGLIAVVWSYPRGKAVRNERDPNLIAGAAGIGVCLGADFIKVNPPLGSSAKERAELLKQATQAAGVSGIVCSGGSSQDSKKFLEEVYQQLHTGDARGVAIGRNIHQKKLPAAIALCNAIAALVFDDSNVLTAQKLLKN